LTSGGASTPVSGKLRGDEITFMAGTTEYNGRVSGNSMQGTVGGTNGNWKATKVGK
jgi:hypothetical protein